MPFKPAYQFLLQRHTDREAYWLKIKRPKWALTEAGSIPGLIATFDAAPENAAWVALSKSGAPDLNLMIGLRAKIAWLCDCRITLRRQFASTKADTPRTQMERERYYYFHNQVCRHALKRMNYILDVERKIPITGKG